MSDHRLKVWVYGPDGKPIRDNASECDCTKKTCQKGCPVVRSHVYSESEVPPAPNHGRTAREPTNTWQDKAKPWFELAALGAAIIGVPFLVIQGCSAQRQADFAEKQLAAMTNQVLEMQKENMTEERAWVTIQHVHFSFPTNDFMDFSFELVNSGKTPADIEEMDLALNIDHIQIGTNNLHGFMLAPNSSFIVHPPPSPSELRMNINPRNYVRWFHSAPSEHTIKIAVQYKDVFGRDCWTKTPFSLDWRRPQNIQLLMKLDDQSLFPPANSDLSPAGSGEMK